MAKCQLLEPLLVNHKKLGIKERELKMLQNNGLSKAALIESKRQEGFKEDTPKDGDLESLHSPRTSLSSNISKKSKDSTRKRLTNSLDTAQL